MLSTPPRGALAFLLLVAAACEPRVPDEGGGTDAATSPVQPEIAPTIPPGTPEELRSAANASNAFGFDVYGKIKKTPGNLVMSPASVSTALTMTYGGAAGATAEEMKKVLHWTAPPEAAMKSSGQLIMDVSSTSPVRLTIANRLFGEKTSKFKQPFIDQSLAAFGAPLEPVNFLGESEAARKLINGWVEDKTAKLIKDLIPEGGVNNSTRLALVNAVYFLGDWMQPFEKEATQPRPFYVTPREPKDVPMMSGVRTVPTSEVDGAVAVELPYKGERFAMTFIMPKTGELAALEQRLDPRSVEAILSAMKPESLDLRVPTFKLAPTAAVELSDALKELGMVQSFDETRADFGPMATEALTIDKVFHKGFIRVDEKGTEAAAATAVVMKNESAGPSGREVVFDRPFLFVLRDTKTGLVLFLGRVADPS